MFVRGGGGKGWAKWVKGVKKYKLAIIKSWRYKCPAWRL